MPWNQRDYLYLGLLVCCVPLQFYFSSSYQEHISKTNHVLELVNKLRNIKESWFSLSSWKTSWIRFLSWVVISIKKEVIDESPAIEVLEYRNKHGLRGKSGRVRDTRSPKLWFRVGQVVEHIYGGYRGVIVEWEFDAKKSNMPIYTILVDESTADETDLTGTVDIEQDQLYLLRRTQVVNRFLKNYFAAYDGSQYIPQPWLQMLYPRD